MGSSKVWDRVRSGIELFAAFKTMKERLLRETNLTLKKALDICRAADASQAQVRSLTTANQPTLTHTNKIRHASQQSRGFLRSTNTKTQLQHFLSCPTYGENCNNCPRTRIFCHTVDGLKDNVQGNPFTIYNTKKNSSILHLFSRS